MDDIVFELRRKVRGEYFTYGELFYDGKEIAKTLEPNWTEGLKGVFMLPTFPAARISYMLEV